MNLLVDQWMPVIRRDGTRAKIAVYELLDDYQDNAVVDLESPRPDFYNALFQLLIWIVQVAAAIIDDAAVGALLVGAAAERYERSRLQQPRWVIDDLVRVTSELEVRLGGEEFGRCHRAGRRRSRTEVVDAAVRALQDLVGGAESPAT